MKSLKVLKVNQPIGEFYIGAIDSRELIDIATVDVREFEKGNPAKIDGIQRDLSKSRLSSLREYVNLDYATFPTSIILAIDERCVELRAVEGCEGLMQLDVVGYSGSGEDGDAEIPIEASAFIIDGQHRLAGLMDRDHSKGPFEVNVSIFVGADVADQAEIFSRVNLAQTKVNKSLMYDLLDYAKESSPYKMAHDVVVALNRDAEGPFHKKIKRLGKRTPGVDGETIAQATMVSGLLRHLPRNQEKERSKSIWGRTSQAEPGETWRERIFVDFYRKEDALSVLLCVSNYFEAISERWPDAWHSNEQGQILSKTTGYNAFIRFLKDAYLHIVNAPRVVEKDEFLLVLKKIDLRDEDFNSEIYLPGGSGAGKLYRDLIAQAFS
ncbi:DGQHR domain-containing protein [Pararhodobacter oceanensis]|uniref:DGQHR domain-containing protein n=1 Tax=Pararhodobacter oceanensis TaxID=2172121 RepID=A0A2T8HP87_9RHOB|nr:DGQHR domain-containing protein [Pararhodobacter oceanensis]PVH27230.1 hypothetical protein DDE20_18745 [Pararhodobacter oceanensis]